MSAEIPTHGPPCSATYPAASKMGQWLADRHGCRIVNGAVACRGPVRYLTSKCERCKAQHWRPISKPQQQFFESQAFMTLYGGSVFSAKSTGVLLDALSHSRTPGWGGVVIRRRRKDLVGGKGSLFAKARKLFRGTGEDFRENPMLDVRWPHNGDIHAGATLEFRHIDAQNLDDYTGLEYAAIYIDEANHVPMDWILFLATRLRSDTGTRCYIKLTCNPDPDHELAKWVEPWLFPDGRANRELSGKLRYYATKVGTGERLWSWDADEVAEMSGRPPEEVKSFTFIPALIEDNPIGMALNPSYVANLTDDPIKEERLRYGNWKVRLDPKGMLPRSRWGASDGELKEPFALIVRRIRGWDRAGSRPKPGYLDPAFTAGVEFSIDVEGRIYVSEVVACRDEPPEVDALMAKTADSDGRSVVQVIQQDPSQAGKAEARHTRRLMEEQPGCGRVAVVKPTKDKVTNAQPLARALKEGMKGPHGWMPRFYILNETGWYDRPYSDEGTAPRTVGELFWSHVEPFFDPSASKKKDIVDAMATAYNELMAMDEDEEEPDDDPIERWRAYG